MKRALIFSAVAAAAVCASAAPAVAGLVGNASFSRQIPVPVPSGATAAQLADDHGDDGIPADADRRPGPSTRLDARCGPTTAVPAMPMPGDDRGGDGTSGEPSRATTAVGDRDQRRGRARRRPGERDQHAQREQSSRGDGTSGPPDGSGRRRRGHDDNATSGERWPWLIGPDDGTSSGADGGPMADGPLIAISIDADDLTAAAGRPAARARTDQVGRWLTAGGGRASPDAPTRCTRAGSRCSSVRPRSSSSRWSGSAARWSAARSPAAGRARCGRADRRAGPERAAARADRRDARPTRRRPPPVLDSLVRANVLSATLVRVKLWTPAGHSALLRRAAARRAHLRSRRRGPARALTVPQTEPRSATSTGPRTSSSAARASCSRCTGRSGRRAGIRCCSRPTSATTRSASAATGCGSASPASS